MQLQRKLTDLYEKLLKSYGYQGWWPLYFSIPSGATNGYFKKGCHPRDYNFPQNSAQKLEICLGAILTQNTKWQNVVPALRELKTSNLFSLTALRKANSEQIAVAIKSAGYYNQKSQTIKRLVNFLRTHSFVKLKDESTPVVREKLLAIKGIGPETADCILLYALDKTSFVIDAYTTRICMQLGIIDKKMSYDELKYLFESSLEKKKELFQEYHALLVCHGKMYYSRKPYGVSDPLINFE
ncbi:MAG: endonuclease III domain-containing protein [Proteobacteria bacterium]|nr:endonuclease III domain-containing protein [Pseudomonadota bacterium]